MKNSKVISWVNIFFSLFLGGILLWGGYKKFEKPIPSPTFQIEQFQSGKIEVTDLPTLKIKNYIFGMKQTNFFWQFLGISEILAGLLILSQFFRFSGALIAMPMTIQIFLFHLFLEPDDIGELIKTALLLAVNIWLIAYEYPKWKHLIFNKSIL